MKRGWAVAVTGGVGCGKSEVGRLWAARGAEVADADQLARAVVDPGQPALDRIVERFGRRILGADGRLDRTALAAVVFADDAARQALEAIVHPPVLAALARWRDEVVGRGGVAVALIPLLFEAGAEAGWDAVVCVSASESVVRQRLQARGWTEEEIERRRRAQWPLAEKERRSDLVVRNDGTLAELAEAVRRLDEWIREKER